jgi:hypothetical protein
VLVWPGAYEPVVRRLLDTEARIIALSKKSGAARLPRKVFRGPEIWRVTVAHFGPTRDAPAGYQVEEERYVSGGNGLWIQKLSLLEGSGRIPEAHVAAAATSSGSLPKTVAAGIP